MRRQLAKTPWRSKLVAEASGPACDLIRRRRGSGATPGGRSSTLDADGEEDEDLDTKLPCLFTAAR